MKIKVCLTLLVVPVAACSLTAAAQGTINFTDRLVTDMTIHIYAPQLSDPTLEVTGNANSTAGVPSDIYYYNGVDANVFNTPLNTATTGGPAIYSGGAIGNTITSNPTAAGAFNFNNGSDYTVQLYAAPGFNAPASALVPVSQYVSSIYTSSQFGGQFRPAMINPDADPGIRFGTSDVTVALVAWFNNGVVPQGQSQSQLSAQLAAAQTGGMPWGQSQSFNLIANGGQGSPPPVDLEGAQSFSLIIIPLPEPNTLTVVLLGAAIVPFFGQRRKIH